MNPRQKPKGVSRRRFLGYIGAGALGGAIATILGTPLIGSFLSPLLAKKSKAGDDWIELGKLADFVPGEPTVVQWVVTTMDGWVSEPVVRSAWVYTPDGKDFVVWNPHCTHLGCAFSWKTSGSHKGHFFSPCHDGVFEIVGVDTRVVSGPPPRPIDTMPMKIENGKIYTVYTEYRKGIADKIEV